MWASTWHFGTYRISANAFFKRPYCRIQRGYICKIWSASSSISILCVCEQRRLWRVCAYAYAQTRLSLRCLKCDKYQNLMFRLIYQRVVYIRRLMKYASESSITFHEEINVSENVESCCLVNKSY